MIRFDGRTGQVRLDASPALFVDPRVSRERPFGDQPGDRGPVETHRPRRIDQPLGHRVLEHPDIDRERRRARKDELELRAKLLGNASHDTVLVKPVTRLALYDERAMARDIGARGLNATGTVYEVYDQTDSSAEIEFDDDPVARGLPGRRTRIRTRINQWIEGDTNHDNQIVFDPDDPDLRRAQGAALPDPALQRRAHGGAPMSRTIPRTNQTRPGFSLVEVLIAILILGLGMLGLAAVFPVVIAQQREAVDTVRGEAAASTAEAIVRSMNEVIEFPEEWFNPDPSGDGSNRRRLWQGELGR